MKKNNRVLAIDPGTHYIGVAVLDGTKLAYYGVKTLSKRVLTLAANVVRKEICGNGWATKRDVAREVYRRFPELVPYLSSDRRWKEEYFYNMFDAVALGVAASSREVRNTKVQR